MGPFGGLGLGRALVMVGSNFGDNTGHGGQRYGGPQTLEWWATVTFNIMVGSIGLGGHLNVAGSNTKGYCQSWLVH